MKAFARQLMLLADKLGGPSALFPGRLQPAPAGLAPGSQIAFFSLGDRPQSGEEQAPEPITETDLIEMKKICASNGEIWRLQMIRAYEQAISSIQYMYLNVEAKKTMEARLLQDLLTELGEYGNE